MIDNERIKEILEELDSRTARGVIIDTVELASEKTKLQFLITEIDLAIERIYSFANDCMPNPVTPNEDDEE